MKIVNKRVISLMILLPLIGCGSGSSGSNSASAKSAGGNIRRIELERRCSAADINDKGEVLVACNLGYETPSVSFEKLNEDDSRTSIYTQENAFDYTVRGFGNDGSVYAAIFTDVNEDPAELKTTHIKIKDGKSTDLKFGEDAFVGAMSPSGQFFDIDEVSSTEIAYFDNGSLKSIASVPSGMQAGSPLSINNSGAAVGIAFLGSEGTGFTTNAAYKVVDGKFDLLSFANRPELNSTAARFINSDGDVLLEIDSGEAQTLPSNPEGEGPISVNRTSLAILYKNGELENVASTSPELPVFGQKLTDSGTVLGQSLSLIEDEAGYFVSGKDRKPVAVSSLIPLVEYERVIKVTINNRDQLLINTAIEITDPSEPSISNVKYIAYVIQY